ncbi:putative Filamentous hemagglutinin family N-terminal domain containing protein [uncultured Desulfatiglans sp.]|nr:putative Filamentous hemagglutinin family N-terminal domain containing protein [uncultured Desulfatiglans sp.]
MDFMMKFSKGCLGLFIFASLFHFCPVSHATAEDSSVLPAGGRIICGDGRIFEDDRGTLTILQQSSRMIVEWDTFDIGAKAKVAFRYSEGKGQTLIRITGPGAARISGSLYADGEILLVDPAGVYFGPSALVDVGGMAASSLDIRDDAFLRGDLIFDGEESAGEIVNGGSIRSADGGCLLFFSPVVENRGELLSPMGAVLLAAGESITLDDAFDLRIHAGSAGAYIDNPGVIQADGGIVLLKARSSDDLLPALIDHSGVIESKTLDGVPGRILLLSDLSNGQVVVSGRLDASASCTGDGGFIETSAAEVSMMDDARISTRAAGGGTGLWCLDPADFIIAPEGGDMTGRQVSDFLRDSNLEIQSTRGAAEGKGDIRIDDVISWSAHTLTLCAYRNIIINRPLNGSGQAGLELVFGQGSADGNVDGEGADYVVNASVNLPADGHFRTKLGSSGEWVPYRVITELGAPGSRSKTDFQGMLGDLTGRYALGADIDASATGQWNNGEGFEPIGGNDPDFPLDVPAFTGWFAGLGHVVKNLSICRETNAIGLFGMVGYGMIRDIGLVDASISGRFYSGGLAGRINSTVVKHCFVTGNVTVLGDTAFGGGLFGAAGASVISNSFNSAKVKDNYHAENMGGIAGVVMSCSFMHCYNAGTVDGRDLVGGLVGCVGNCVSNGLRLSDCYNSGKIIAPSRSGGLVGGFSCGSSVSSVRSYWDIESSGQETSCGGIGLSTARMKEAATFAGWDIDGEGYTDKLWRIYEGCTYPLLRTFLKRATAVLPGKKVYDGTRKVGVGSFVWAVDSGDPFDPSAVFCDQVKTESADAGTYPLDLSGFYSVQLGYDIKFAGVPTFTITKAPLTVTAKDDRKTYDGKPYSGGNGVIYAGLVHGESEGVLDGSVMYGGSSQGAVRPGSYAIAPSGLSSKNYDIVYCNGTLTIEPTTARHTIVVSADPVGGGTAGGGGVLDAGTQATVSAVANPCYTFIHWSENGRIVCTTPTYTFWVAEDRNLTAHFQMAEPVISGLTPSEALAGGEEFSLSVRGGPFCQGSMVYWDGSERKTAFVSPESLTAEIYASDIAKARMVAVTIVNRAADGSSIQSEPKYFVIRDAEKPAKAIPTLSDWGVILCAFLMFASAIIVLKRSRKA